MKTPGTYTSPTASAVSAPGPQVTRLAPQTLTTAAPSASAARAGLVNTARQGSESAVRDSSPKSRWTAARATR